nr:MAG TPA: hypothetical protein [Caudoviricetes sp.]
MLNQDGTKKVPKIKVSELIKLRKMSQVFEIFFDKKKLLNIIQE